MGTGQVARRFRFLLLELVVWWFRITVQWRRQLRRAAVDSAGRLVQVGSPQVRFGACQQQRLGVVRFADKVTRTAAVPRVSSSGVARARGSQPVSARPNHGQCYGPGYPSHYPGYGHGYYPGYGYGYYPSYGYGYYPWYGYGYGPWLRAPHG